MAIEVQRTHELARLRGFVDQALTVVLWLYVPLIAGVAWFQGNALFALGGGAAPPSRRFITLP
jgi:hypothetical protein